MKSDIQFEAISATEIKIVHTTIMTVQEYLAHAQEVYIYATTMANGARTAGATMPVLPEPTA